MDGMVKLPYGRGTVEAEIPQHRLQAALVSQMHAYRPEKTPSALVKDALENPIGRKRLRELAAGGSNIVIIASDHTRPVPSKVIMPLILKELRAGNERANITILIATGCHRGTTKAELIEKFGKDIVRHERIVVHDCDDTAGLVKLGTLPSGGELIINRVAAQADLLLAEGFIEPHFFAGFSGSGKSVLPGIAGRQTVLMNHCAEFIAHKKAKTGVVAGNPIQEDIAWAARKAKLAFIVNVIVNSEKEVVYAVAGDAIDAHKEGCRFLSALCRVTGRPSDIVITTNGGYPLDQNIYQAVKGMTAAEAAIRKNGVIIMLARSEDGHGSENFYKAFKAGGDLDAMRRDILSRGRAQTLPDQWQVQILIRVLQHAHVIYVSDAPPELVAEFRMIPAKSVGEALRIAEDILHDENASISVIPDGVSVIVD